MESIIIFVIAQLITGAAIWGAIRADIRNMHERLDRIGQSTKDAHQRIDRHIELQLSRRADDQ